MFDLTLKFEYKDGDTVTKRDLDLRRMMIRETDELKSLTGWVPVEWLNWLDQRDGKALGYGWYLACQRNGDTITWLDVLDTLNLFDLEFELDAGEETGETTEAVNPDDPTLPTSETTTS